MMRRLLIGIGLLACAASGIALVYREELRQLWVVAHLFDEDRIVENFQHMDDLFPTRRVAASSTPRIWESEPGSAFVLPERFLHDGRAYHTEAFLEQTDTTGLLVIHADTLRFERYQRGHSREGLHIGWSVSKSIVSALFGVALAEGAVDDIRDPVTKYVPELAGSGYDGVAIKDVLQMSSGVGFDENYGDPDSDINRMGRVLAMGGTLLDFASSLARVRPPGTLQHYVSIDTQVLGEILVRATGMNLADYTREKLWDPIGSESEAYWTIDGSGREMAFGGFNASLRDFAKLGLLYLDEGRVGGRQIVPAEWVRASVSPDAPHLQPGPKPGTTNRMGYGYQWWIPEDSTGQFLALGVYNQMVYVDPTHRLVIAKHSANRDFQRDDFESTRETLALFRQIAADLGP